MTDCTAYRRALLSDPRELTEELLAHGRDCADCAAFAERAARFEARLEGAMRLNCVDPPAPAGALPEQAAGSEAGVIPLRRDAARIGGHAAARDAARDRVPAPAVRSRWFAVAASCALAAATLGLLWIAVPRTSLAGDVVSHMAGEPAAWAVTDAAVSAAQLDAVLRDTHMRLEEGAGVVSYASSCEFRGHRVPHLVVQDESGPVTVMVLVHESVKTPVEFDEQHYRGVILPVPDHGSIAVLTRNQRVDQAALERIAKRVENTIAWTG
jgi:hypothetical protein